jgi:hypothetical protein
MEDRMRHTTLAVFFALAFILSPCFLAAQDQSTPATLTNPKVDSNQEQTPAPPATTQVETVQMVSLNFTVGEKDKLIFSLPSTAVEENKIKGDVLKTIADNLVKDSCKGTILITFEDKTTKSKKPYTIYQAGAPSKLNAEKKYDMLSFSSLQYPGEEVTKKITDYLETTLGCKP